MRCRGVVVDGVVVLVSVLLFRIAIRGYIVVSRALWYNIDIACLMKAAVQWTFSAGFRVRWYQTSTSLNRHDAAAHWCQPCCFNFPVS